MSLQAEYLAAIKQFEGFTRAAKWDYAQYSNGYGTVARHPGEVITEAEADRRFRSEIASAYSLVERFAPNADAGTKAALTSLTYNAGTAWMKDGLGDAIRRADYDTARQIFLQYNKAGGDELAGLVARRQTEAAWFGGGGPVSAGGSPSEIAAGARAATAAQPDTIIAVGEGAARDTSVASSTAAVALLRAKVQMLQLDAAIRLNDAERAAKDQTA